MEVKLVVIVVIAIISGAIGSGMSYSVLNPMVVRLDDQLQVVVSDVADVNGTLQSLPTEWTALDFQTLSDSVSGLHDSLLTTQSALSNVNETVMAIDGRKWHRVYRESNLTHSANVGWYNTTSFPVQGSFMKIDWTLWCNLGDAGAGGWIIIEIHMANGTLLDSIGTFLPYGEATITSEIAYNVENAGEYYLTLRVIEHLAGLKTWYEVNVWDYY